MFRSHPRLALRGKGVDHVYIVIRKVRRLLANVEMLDSRWDNSIHHALDNAKETRYARTM
jgi:hypothetical protein